MFWTISGQLSALVTTRVFSYLTSEEHVYTPACPKRGESGWACISATNMNILEFLEFLQFSGSFLLCSGQFLLCSGQFPGS